MNEEEEFDKRIRSDARKWRNRKKLTVPIHGQFSVIKTSVLGYEVAWVTSDSVKVIAHYRLLKDAKKKVDELTEIFF